MDESDGLENRCGRKATVGSNPTSSAHGRNNNVFPSHCPILMFDRWDSFVPLIQTLTFVPHCPDRRVTDGFGFSSGNGRCDHGRSGRHLSQVDL